MCSSLTSAQSVWNQFRKSKKVVYIAVSLTVMHTFFIRLHRPFLVLSCICVLWCLVHAVTRSPCAFTIFPQVQHRCSLGHRGSLTLRFNITENSSFGRTYRKASRALAIFLVRSFSVINWWSLACCDTMRCALGLASSRSRRKFHGPNI